MRMFHVEHFRTTVSFELKSPDLDAGAEPRPDNAPASAPGRYGEAVCLPPAAPPSTSAPIRTLRPNPVRATAYPLSLIRTPMRPPVLLPIQNAPAPQTEGLAKLR